MIGDPQAARIGAYFLQIWPFRRRAGIGIARLRPWVASSMAALSRTLREITCWEASPAQPSPTNGPNGLRPRVGFKPNSPQLAAGIRIDPPPSLPWPMGTMPAATAAAVPPEDPPAERFRFQGLRVGPKAWVSVEMLMPNSDVVVRAIGIAPVSFTRVVWVKSVGAMKPL